MKIVLSTFGLMLTLASPALAESFFISQSGTGNGASCSASQSAAWFNSAGSWASPKQAGRIGPGDTIYMCGTVTTDLRLQGNGTSGSPITVDGDSATLSSGFSFETNGRSWWVLRNMTWQDGASSTPFSITSGSNGIVDTCHADQVAAASVVWMNQAGGSRPNNIVIRNCFFRTASTDFGGNQHDMIVSEGSTNVVIEGNYLEMRAGGSGGSAHDDVIQTYEKGGTSAGPPGNWTIRFNYIVMNSSVATDRSWTMLENLDGNNYIYGNVFLGLNGGSSANGMALGLSPSGATFHVYNNTYVAKSGSNNTIGLGNEVAFLKNNLVRLASQMALTGASATTRSNNMWFGSNIPSCSGISGERCGVDPMLTNFNANDFSLQSSSPAKGAGVNLGTGPSGHMLDYGIAPGSSWPNPTLVRRTGAWDVGAFVGSSATGSVTPAAPSNLRILSSE